MQGSTIDQEAGGWLLFASAIGTETDDFHDDAVRAEACRSAQPVDFGIICRVKRAGATAAATNCYRSALAIGLEIGIERFDPVDAPDQPVEDAIDLVGRERHAERPALARDPVGSEWSRTGAQDCHDDFLKLRRRPLAIFAPRIFATCAGTGRAGRLVMVRQGSGVAAS